MSDELQDPLIIQLAKQNVLITDAFLRRLVVEFEQQLFWSKVDENFNECWTQYIAASCLFAGVSFH
jgi:hypothetical protein